MMSPATVWAFAMYSAADESAVNGSPPKAAVGIIERLVALPAVAADARDKSVSVPSVDEFRNPSAQLLSGDSASTPPKPFATRVVGAGVAIAERFSARPVVV